MVLMCMVPDLICSSSVNRTGVLFVYWLYGVFEELSQLGNNYLFWVVGPLMCVVVCNHPDWVTLSPLGRKLNKCFLIHSVGSNSLFYPQM